MPSEIAQKVAHRIRSLRTSQHLSLRELSRRSGLAPESVSRSERGAHEISLTNLERLCSALGVTLAQFFDFGAGAPVGARALGDAGHVQSLLERADAPLRARVLKIVAILLESERSTKAAARVRKARRAAP